MSQSDQPSDIPETAVGAVKWAWKWVKRIVDLERRIAAIEGTGNLDARVAALEVKMADLLSGKSPADVCRKCGNRTLRFESSKQNGAVEVWVCHDPACGSHERRQVNPR